jgi:hypothetical protein
MAKWEREVTKKDEARAARKGLREQPASIRLTSGQRKAILNKSDGKSKKPAN